MELRKISPPGLLLVKSRSIGGLLYRCNISDFSVVSLRLATWTTGSLFRLPRPAGAIDDDQRHAAVASVPTQRHLANGRITPARRHERLLWQRANDSGSRKCPGCSERIDRCVSICDVFTHNCTHRS